MYSNMKKIQLILSVLVITVFLFSGCSQIKELTTAKNFYQDYLNYGMKEGKTESLEKAKSNIDTAMKTLAGMKSGNDGKLKPATEASAWLYKGLIYTQLSSLANKDFAKGALKPALEAIKKALALDTKGTNKKMMLQALDVLRSNAYNDGINAFKNLKDYKSAYNLFDQSLSITDLLSKNSKDPVIDTAAIVMSAYSAQNSNNIDGAIAKYEQLDKLNYEDVQIYQSLNSLYASKGETAKAKAAIEKGKKKFPDQADKFLIGEINYLLKEKKSAEALAKMQEASQKFPDNASLFFALGTTYEGIGNDNPSQKKEMTAKAESSYKKALELEPDFFDCLYNIGALYYNQAAELTKEANNLDLNATSKYDQIMNQAKALFNQALPYFLKAEKINGEDLNTLVALKEIYANMGDLEKTKKYKEKFNSLKK